jgi:hypothetical protein
MKVVPRVLVLDIETMPIEAYVWGLYNIDSIGINQIKEDWHLLSFAAKWLDEKEVIYMDVSKEKNLSNDKKLIQKLWELLDKADAVVGQNSDSFDLKKINARIAHYNMPPPSSYTKIDTKKMAKKYFAFTSNSLEFLSKELNVKNKKSNHKKFPGFSLWLECAKGNQEAWKELSKYNKLDVLSTEELYKKLRAWGDPINPDLYSEGETNTCTCGSTEWKKNGIKPLSSGLFQRYVCKSCGYETRSKKNLLSKEKIKSLRAKIAR